MKHLKGLQRTIIASAAVAVLAFGAAPAKAGPGGAGVPTAFGSCIDVAGSNDCVTAVGHISASVVGTLSINEQRAISFGNFAVATAPGAGTQSTIVLDTAGVRTENDGAKAHLVLLTGANATGGPGAPDGAGPGTSGAGSQSPGHYTVETGSEGSTTQVYISFADPLGNIVDTCSTTDATCDKYHAGNVVTITDGVSNFFVDQFTFNETGNDVYGHYIRNDGTPQGPGVTNPFLHDRTNPTAVAGVVDVVVGATLHTDPAAVAYAAGKYSGTFDVMVSY